MCVCVCMVHFNMWLIVFVRSCCAETLFSLAFCCAHLIPQLADYQGQDVLMHSNALIDHSELEQDGSSKCAWPKGTMIFPVPQLLRKTP